ncbi:MAG: isocitrate lyase/phosphoenolpyruvate mutase family protein [Frankiaceae bacterium]|nr:isocitrate lyase/phosphoenolpyruvate mutase family protein [Frankiaceae bacterium]MBV9869969.1 isocitrate lyase/phosphoenolpyruvate mutase family protein [Frankiaceae bacterium]
MTDRAARAVRFLELHAGPTPLLIPNPWDAGSARVLASIGFQALATTSSGFAATLGKLDGSITREQALDHAEAIAAATDLPVSADLENCFAHDPAGVAETVALARGTGLAGCSIEDFTGTDDDPIYPLEQAAERVAAAAEAAHGGEIRLVLTARSENYLHGRVDLADTIARLEAFQAAGADVLYAPGLSKPDEIRSVVSSVDLPVNVLALPSGPDVAALAALGVRRISVGGAFAYAAIAGLVEAGREFLDHGTLKFWDRSAVGGAAARAAFTR